MSATRPLVWVALGPSVDISYRLGALRVGDIERPLEVVQVPGGKGLNAARVAHVLGAGGIVLGVVGGHGGGWIRQALTEEGVEADLFEGRQPTRTCVSLAHQRPPGMTEVYPRAAPLGQAEWVALARLVRRHAVSGGWVLLSGAAAPGRRSRDGVRQLVAAAQEAGAHVGVDSSGDTLLSALAAGADLVKVNTAEVRDLLKDVPPSNASSNAGRDESVNTPDPVSPAAELAGEVLRRAPTVSVAVVTDGPRTAAMVSRWNGELLTATASPPSLAGPTFPVGSGDAFFAGLLAGWLAQNDLPTDRLEALQRMDRSLRLAVAAGAANALRLGAGRLLRDDVERFLCEVPAHPAGR